MDLTAAYGFRMDWIVSFVAVARHGGFSAAAKATFRSQSRISEHVAELEKALGAPAVTTANLTGVRLVPIRDSGVERQVALYVHRDRPHTPALDQVITAVRAVPAPTWP
ncbi:MAG TPA: LysR family transcriptional regulator [Kribbella sp.]|nr:LysR family transcriptional regulator [Kribbella sp.]